VIEANASQKQREAQELAAAEAAMAALHDDN
jgi:hypothetical protein